MRAHGRPDGDGALIARRVPLGRNAASVARMHAIVERFHGRSIALPFLAAVAIVASAGAGCFNAASHNADNRTSLLTRASFDLNCPEMDLEVAVLETDAMDIVTSYGVRGCGRRVSYVRASGAWVANVMDGQTSGAEATGGEAAPPAPPPTPATP